MKLVSFLFGTTVFAVMLCSIAGAEKITADPNATPKVEIPSAEPLWKTDKRLDQKIEYDAGGTRLYKVIRELAEKSGLTISCGSGSDDWRVRDIPVTVASRGLKLSDLLGYINFATHTKLTAKKNTKDEIVYAVVDNGTATAIADNKRAVADYYKKHVTWSVETAKRLKDIQPSQVKNPMPWPLPDLPSQMDYTFKASRLMEFIDKPMLDSIISGTPVILTASTAPATLQPALIDFLNSVEAYKFAEYSKTQVDNRKWAAESGQNYPYDDIAPATQDQIRNSAVRLAVRGNGIEIHSCVMVNNPKEAFPTREAITSTDFMAQLAVTSKALSDLPAEPKDFPQMPEVKPATIGLTNNSYWPELAKTYKLKLDDKKPLSYCDIAIAYSKAADLSMVFIDDLSHQGEETQPPPADKEIDCSEAMCPIIGNIAWDKENRCIVSIPWLGRLSTIPERIFNNITNKANSSGADWQDIAELADYPDMIERSCFSQKIMPALPVFDFQVPRNKPLWQIYNSLPSDRKTMVASETGLKLDAKETERVVDFFENNLKNGSESNFISAVSAKWWDEFLIPEVTATLVMRVDRSDKSENKSFGPSNTATADIPGIPHGFLNKHWSRMSIEGIKDGKKIKIDFQSQYDFPYFSAARQKELEEAIAKQSEEK
ncbi:MAG: hypothetical protein NT018_10815 [Armatimonadetes bacterium]|nr:hypothetical protein [Armatimonadota bacterium]